MSTIQKTTLKRFNGTDWDPIHLATSADITRVGADITIMGNNIGAFKVGDTIKAADSVQATIRKMVQTRIEPSYTRPGVSLRISSGTAKGKYEAGTTINATLQSEFIKNDAGDLTAHSIKKNDIDVVTGTDNLAEYTFNAVLGDETVTFVSTAAFGEGVIKNDNLGDASPNRHIEAGSTTSSKITYTGIRNAFYGYDTDGVQDALATSAAIRALNVINGPVYKTSFISANVPAGATRFTLAFESKIGTLGEVLYKESGNANITSQFSLTKVNVEGANGYTAVEYNVYTISWAQPTAGRMTFSIKI